MMIVEFVFLKIFIIQKRAILYNHPVFSYKAVDIKREFLSMRLLCWINNFNDPIKVDKY